MIVAASGRTKSSQMQVLFNTELSEWAQQLRLYIANCSCQDLFRPACCSAVCTNSLSGRHSCWLLGTNHKSYLVCVKSITAANFALQLTDNMQHIDKACGMTC